MSHWRALHFHRAARAAFLVALLAAACRMPDALVSGMFSEPETALVPAAADCERCHQEVYREWQDSLHARAWVHDRFQSASADARAEACVGCHAPGPVTGTAPPSVRAERREEGVTCITCHLSPRPDAAPLTMRGPLARTSPIEIHPIVEADPLFRSSELCGTCHAGTLAEWQTASAPVGGEKQTCQGCHMPGVRRKMESVHDEHAYSALFVALSEDNELRRHTFDVPEPAEGEIVLEAWPDPTRAVASVTVTVRNLLPHGLPTGSYGPRTVRLLLSWPEGTLVRERNARRQGPIEVGATWTERFELPAGVASELVEVRLERREHQGGGWGLLRSARLTPKVSAP
jgi:hypothetical protein